MIKNKIESLLALGGKTVLDMCKDLGFNQSTISQKLNKYSTFNVEEINKILDYLKCEYNDLFYEMDCKWLYDDGKNRGIFKASARELESINKKYIYRLDNCKEGGYDPRKN